ASLAQALSCRARRPFSSSPWFRLVVFQSSAWRDMPPSATTLQVPAAADATLDEQACNGVGSLEGRWVTRKRTQAGLPGSLVIHGDRVLWKSGHVWTVRHDGGASFTVAVRGKTTVTTFRARRVSSDQLEWDDGDVWSRVPDEDFPPLPSAAGTRSGARAWPRQPTGQAAPASAEAPPAEAPPSAAAAGVAGSAARASASAAPAGGPEVPEGAPAASGPAADGLEQFQPVVRNTFVEFADGATSQRARVRRLRPTRSDAVDDPREAVLALAPLDPSRGARAADAERPVTPRCQARAGSSSGSPSRSCRSTRADSSDRSCGVTPPKEAAPAQSGDLVAGLPVESRDSSSPAGGGGGARPPVWLLGASAGRLLKATWAASRARGGPRRRRQSDRATRTPTTTTPRATAGATRPVGASTSCSPRLCSATAAFAGCCRLWRQRCIAACFCSWRPSQLQPVAPGSGLRVCRRAAVQILGQFGHVCGHFSASRADPLYVLFVMQLHVLHGQRRRCGT
ncbi:unnamed protein product, partial [Prorocentrum cordatum]